MKLEGVEPKSMQMARMRSLLRYLPWQCQLIAVYPMR